MFSFQVIQAHFVILATSKIFVEITGMVFNQVRGQKRKVNKNIRR
jgi:hypothetical protein